MNTANFRRVHNENLRFFPNCVTNIKMDYRQKMVVSSSHKVKHEDDDDEDLEALRLAALKSLRAKNTLQSTRQPTLLPLPVKPRTAYQHCPTYNHRGASKRGYYQNRLPRQNGNVYYHSRVNQNLIEIVPMEEEDALPKDPAPTDHKTFKTESQDNRDAEGDSKFYRYKDTASGSEEEDTKETNSTSTTVLTPKSERLEKLCTEGEESGTEKDTQSGTEESPRERVNDEDAAEEDEEEEEDDEEEEEEKAANDDDDDDVLLMADLEEEDSLERLMDEMEREMNVDKSTDRKDKKSTKKDTRESRKTVEVSRPCNRKSRGERENGNASGAVTTSTSLPSMKNERRSVSPRPVSRNFQKRRSLSPKPRLRKKSPRRSPRRSPPRSKKLREMPRMRSPRKLSPPSRFSPRSRSPKLSPRPRSPRSSPRRSPNRSPMRRSPIRKSSPRGRSPMPIARSRSPRPPRSPPKRSNRSRSPRNSPMRLSPRARTPRSKSPRLSPLMRRSSPRSRSPRLSPRRSAASPRPRSPKLSPERRRGSPMRLRSPVRRSPVRRSPVRPSPHQSPWSSPRDSPRLSPRRRRSPKETTRKPRRSVTPEDISSTVYRRDASPARKNAPSPENVRSKIKQRESTVASSGTKDSNESNNDPILEARRRKFECNKPIDPIHDNKKIKLCKKDHSNKRVQVAEEPPPETVESPKTRKSSKIPEPDYEDPEESDLCMNEDYVYDEDVVSDDSASNTVTVCEEIVPVKVEKERSKKKKKRDKEIYQVGKLKGGEMTLSERIGKAKKCKKRKDRDNSPVADSSPEQTPVAVEDLTVDEEGDLRTELSRRRAERLNRAVPIQSARLLQSAFKGVVNEVAKTNAKVIQRHAAKGEDKNNKKEVRRVTVLHRALTDLPDSEEEAVVDSKVPVRFRLGINKPSQDSREPKVARKSSKRPGRKRS